MSVPQTATPPPAAGVLVVEAVEATVGSMAVRRALPTRRKRTVGPWCFLDHFGPADVASGPGMKVGPHPHIGLQTVTWLAAGEVVHRDSLGSEQPIRPGQLNVMTAGRGIAHAEESPLPHPPRLHGVQMWVALPESERRRPPAFDHIPALPTAEIGGWRARVLLGTLAGETSPAPSYSPLVGAELTTSGPAAGEVPLDGRFEHGLVVMEGAVVLDGVETGPGSAVVAAPGRASWHLSTSAPARVLLVGGPPFPDPLVMWWNFVAGSAEEIAAARRDWEEGRRFGARPFTEVAGAVSTRESAPRLPAARLKSRT